MSQIGDYIKSRIAGDPKGFSLEEQKRYRAQYAESMGFSQGFGATEGFNTYAEARISGLAGFSKLTTPSGDNLSEKLQANAEIQETIMDALKLSETTEQARTDFNENIAAINAMIRDPESVYDPRTLVSYLHEVKSDAHRAISDQHQLEREQLSQKFENNQFVQQLKTSLGLETDEQVTKIKKDMLATLEKSQKEELAKFDKTLNDSIIKMHQEAQKEQDRIAFLAALYDKNKNMQREIDRLYAQNRKSEGSGVTIEYDGHLKKAILKGINPKDLPTIETVTGRKIERSPDGKSFSMHLPNRLFSPFYYGGWNSKMKADMMSLAQAVKASGHDAITMNVSHKNRERAMELGRQAYMASLEAGFDEKKITVKVNGETMSAEKLFAESPSELQAARTRATTNKETRKDESKTRKDTSAIKEALSQYRRQESRSTEQQESDEQQEAGRPRLE